MATEVILPRVDMDMETGKFANWLVKEGETVQKGQPLFEIDTDKAAMEVEAPASGVLKGVCAAPGDVLPVGATVGWIAGPDETIPLPDAKRVAPIEAPAAVARIGAEAAAIAMPASEHAAASLHATPLARRLAREAGVDLSVFSGSGPAGRIQARDIASTSPFLASPGAGELHREWLVRGEGAPIILIHGFGADSGGWAPLIVRLGGKRPVLALDLSGHGQSALTGTPTFDDLVEAVERCVEAEGVRRGHWVAHSLGGAVAARAARRRPASVASLTLLAPAGLGPEINSGFLQGFLRARTEASLGPILRLLVEDEAALGNALVKTTLRQRQERGLEASLTAIADIAFPDGVQAIDIHPDLSAYPGPTKLVAGRHDRIIPPDHARAAPGHVGVHLLEGVGHMPHLEARDLVARLTLDNIAAGERAAP